MSALICVYPERPSSSSAGWLLLQWECFEIFTLVELFSYSNSLPLLLTRRHRPKANHIESIKSSSNMPLYISLPVKQPPAPAPDLPIHPSCYSSLTLLQPYSQLPPPPATAPYRKPYPLSGFQFSCCSTLLQGASDSSQELLRRRDVVGSWETMKKASDSSFKSTE